jgi:imidazolonepropionase-like amidohydrolase
MAKADMTFRQILESLTTAPAKRFGLFEKTGRIAPGMDADIAILGSNPATDVHAFSNVQYTLRTGKMIYQSHQRDASSLYSNRLGGCYNCNSL